MYRKTLSVWAMTMLIASCAKSLPAPVVVDTACSWVRIIYLTDHDIDVWISRPSVTFWRTTKQCRPTARNSQRRVPGNSATNAEHFRY
jgi:hypothetical protein